MRVLIADDHPLFRLGLKYALQAQGFQVVAEADTGNLAIAVCDSHPVDVAILDVKMTDGDGLHACQVLVERDPKLVVILLTTFQEPALIQAARQAGARGFLSKETDPSYLADTIHRIIQQPEKDWLPVVMELPRLTPRELSVLQLMTQGLANKQIARRLGISIETVKEYASGIYRKLGVSDRVTAVFKAQELGLLS
ncbi:MAG: response regulator transcription factor [Synechococcaceae cyanobacterium SM2_3_1]|nr:response regulator transcription factor [Synechococcaceae cyanobacterium SM2_3_1]